MIANNDPNIGLAPAFHKLYERHQEGEMTDLDLMLITIVVLLVLAVVATVVIIVCKAVNEK